MMGSAFADMESLRVGAVVAASPEAIEVQLEIDAPDSVALNAKTPRRFPRINGYLLIPNDVGFTVGQVSWIKVVNSPYPKRKGLKDFGLIDLPFPLRTLSLMPIGTLKKNLEEEACSGVKFVFQRGVESFPTVGDGVLLPTNGQLAAIVTAGKNLRVKIGTSPLAANADVKVDPDRLFGRHLAVLGNTGSGKSCSVAGLIRWSLEAAEKEIKGQIGASNARFIILDPNGEYHRAFRDRNPMILSIAPSAVQSQLRLPVWFWNSEEWFSFFRAGEKAHQPILRRALREMRSGRTLEEKDEKRELRLIVSRILVKLSSLIDVAYEGYRIAPTIEKFIDDFDYCIEKYGSEGAKLRSANTFAHDILSRSQYKTREGKTGYNSFAVSNLIHLQDELKRILNGLGGCLKVIGTSEDVPIRFDVDLFLNHLESLVEENNNSQMFGYFLSRIKMALSDIKMKDVLEGGPEMTLASWLEQILGTAKQSQLTIVDFSLVPPHLLYVLTSVVSRMVFEALQRHRQVTGNILPSVLVVEEAHNFVKRYVESAETPLPNQICCQVFERIAKEGRKFGLGLVLSSQRPSELSPTVLSQCNSFLLHRITNDKDQELIRRLLPDTLHGLLRDLPTLPARNAILLGWAAELPTLVRMNELALAHQPQSQDPHFWKVWTRRENPDTDWKMIADEWQGNDAEAETDAPPADGSAPEAPGT